MKKYSVYFFTFLLTRFNERRITNSIVYNEGDFSFRFAPFEMTVVCEKREDRGNRRQAADYLYPSPPIRHAVISQRSGEITQRK